MRAAEPRTHTPPGLSSRLEGRPALCPGCWELEHGGVLLHRMRPRLYLGSDWARKITATPPFPPLLPEGFCVHILPVDYQRCQSRVLHSSCCPHCGSGANLSRQHRGEKTFSHGSKKQSRCKAQLLSELSPSVSAGTYIKHNAPCKTGQSARTLSLS